MTNKMDRILSWLKEHPGYYSPTEIGMKALGKNYSSASAACSLVLNEMRRLEYIKCAEKGVKYSYNDLMESKELLEGK